MNLTIIVPSDEELIEQRRLKRESILGVFSPSCSHHPWVYESLSILKKQEKKLASIFNLNDSYQLLSLLEKEKKDLQAPRSAYSFFFKDKRKTMVPIHPDKNGYEIAKMLGSVWRKLPSQIKDGYYILEENDEKRFEKESEKIDQKIAFLERMIYNMEYNLQ